MRAKVSASAAVMALASCAKPHVPMRHDPPARVLSTTIDAIAVRANAAVELHAWLAAGARSGAAMPAELEDATRGYAEAVSNDDDDQQLARAADALAACADDGCTRHALGGTAYALPFERSMPLFVARWWTDRATKAHVAIDAIRAAYDPMAEGLARRIASDLGVAWGERTVTVDVVSEAPPAGRHALLPLALAARSTCFARSSTKEDPNRARIDQARVLDCTFVRLFTKVEEDCALGQALRSELGERAHRAFSLVVVHEVATRLASWEPRHVSPSRQSANVVEAELLRWLADNWRPPLDAAGTKDFVSRYSRTIRDRAVVPR
jgi:hypothetical protein